LKSMGQNSKNLYVYPPFLKTIYIIYLNFVILLN
jgi:hypothetical protein